MPMAERAASQEAPAASGVGGRWRRGGAFVSLMTAASVLGLAKTLVFAKVLGPEGLGYYGYAVLVLQFGLYASNWGILNGLNVELPLAYGRRDEAADRRAGSALSSLGVTAAITAAIYIAVVSLAPIENPNVRVALLLAGLLAMLSTLSEFYILLMRARRQLVPLSLTYFLRAVLAIALGAAAGALWGFEGVLVSEFAALLIVIVIAARVWVPDIIPRRPHRTEAVNLIKVGLPLMASNLVVAGSLFIDRLFVAAELPEQFGQYTFASLVVTTAIAISGMLNQAVAPQLLYERGAGSSLLDLRRRLMRITSMVVGAAAIGLLALFAAISLLEDGLLQEYSAGLETMPILYIGGAASVVAIYGVLLLAARRFVLTMIATGLGALTALGGCLVVARVDPSLEGFAWVFAISQIVATLAVVVASEIEIRRNPTTAA